MATTSIARPAHSALDAALETLEHVTTMVDAYERGDDPVAPWERCQQHLDEVRGALIMLEMEGARLLVDECIAIMAALDADDALSHRHAMDALLYALLLLPRYISRARKTGRETPETLLPTINGLRSLRRSVLIPDYHFAGLAQTSPDLTPLADQFSPPVPTDVNTRRRLRHMLQAGLLGLFRAPDACVHFKQINRALARLSSICGNTPAGRWLGLAANLAAEATERGQTADGSMRLLISRLDFYIRSTLCTEPAATDQIPPALVREALLFYAGQVQTDTGIIGCLSRELSLPTRTLSAASLARERDAVCAPDDDVLESVSLALGEELQQIQAFIETIGRLSSVTHTERHELSEHLHRLGHTLTLLGLSEQAAAVKREHTRLQSAGDHVGGERLREILDQCAETLSASEDAVNRLARPGSATPAERGALLGEAGHQAVAEALSNLERVRQGLEYFNGDRDDGEELTTVEPALNEIRGSMEILDLPRAADLLTQAGKAVADLNDQDANNGERLNAIADALAAIEWYLESLLEGIDTGDEALAIADASLTGGNGDAELP